MNGNQKPKYQQMLNKLNELYDEQDNCKKQIENWFVQLNQLNEDIELLETLIMHQYNKEARKKC
jgi:archaellum component FlaC